MFTIERYNLIISSSSFCSSARIDSVRFGLVRFGLFLCRWRHILRSIRTYVFLSSFFHHRQRNQKILWTAQQLNKDPSVDFRKKITKNSKYFSALLHIGYHIFLATFIVFFSTRRLHPSTYHENIDSFHPRILYINCECIHIAHSIK